MCTFSTSILGSLNSLNLPEELSALYQKPVFAAYQIILTLLVYTQTIRALEPTMRAPASWSWFLKIEPVIPNENYSHSDMI